MSPDGEVNTAKPPERIGALGVGELPPDTARYREHHGRLPPVTPGHLGRRRRPIPVSALSYIRN
jgi:hypothetical protein